MVILIRLMRIMMMRIFGIDKGEIEACERCQLDCSIRKADYVE